MSSSDHDLPNDTRRRHRIGDEESVSECQNTTEHDETSDEESHRLSSRERDIQRARQVVDKTPDIREDRVAAAKQALKSGRLNLRGTDLAEKLLRDELHQADVDV